MSLAARGLLALLVVACASLTDRPVLAQRQGINNYNGNNGNSNNVRWSPQPSAAALRQNPSNLLYQTSNNLVNKPQQQQQQQQQQQRNESPKVVTQDQDSSIEYVEYEYYDDDEEIPGAGAPAESSTSTSTTSTTTSTTTTTTLKPEVRAAKAQSAPVLYDDDDYYYDDEYEDEPQQQVDDDKKSPPANNNNNKTADGSLLSYKVQKESNETGSVQQSDESEEFIGEVVSVVTTKSVVNGTYSVPEVTESPQPTSTMTSTTKKATTPATTSTTTTTTTTTAAPTSPNTTSKSTTTTREATTTTTTTTTTKSTTSTPPPSTTTTARLTSTTEFSPSSTIQASVQTSRSVSGARFLPYPSIFEFDKPLTKQQQKDKDKQDSNNKNNEAKSEEEEVDEDEKSTADKDEEEDEKKETQVEKQLDEQKDQPEQQPQPQQPTSDSTESIIDKLDRVQSELSSGFLAHGRFVPRRYQKKPFSTTSLILPPTSTIAPTSSPIPPITITSIITKRPRVQTTIEDVSAFLPKDYPKGNNNGGGGRFTTATKRPKVQTTIEDVSAFLPKDFPRYGQASTTTTTSTTQASPSSTKRPKFQTTLEDVEAFLPKDYPKGGYRGSYKRPGSYKTTAASSNARTTSSTSTTSTTEKSTASTSKRVQTTKDDISAFLPQGYKLKPEEATTEKASILTEILLKSKVIGPDNTKISQTSSVSQSSRVSNGSSSSQDTSKPKPPPLEDLFVKTAAIDAALLPPGYKPEPKSPNRTNDLIVEKIPLAEILAKSAVDVSALLPPGYKPDAVKPLKKSEESNDAAAAGQVDAESDKPSNSNNSKIVYPRRPGGNHRKSPAAKLTTPPVAVQSTPSIKKGWPTRATTEFTGWPSTSTTPISIAKLVEVARTATAGDLSAAGGLVPITSEIDSTTTSTTTTTTTTTMRPTTPGLCDGECEVAGTIRIVENANWAPELLDRNTIEWQELAEEIEREMNLVFAKSPVLRKWFRKIRIDSFSPGSVLVDYFVELEDLKERINTQQLKVIFHDSLRTFNFDNPMEVTPVKAPVKLGKFVIDPKSTDFVVIPRIASPKVSEDENRLIPQWAIAVIVVGVTGLLFIIVFGIIVVNRQNGSKLKPALSSIYDDSMTKNVMSSHHNTPAPTPSSRPPAAMLAHHDYQQKHHGGGGHSGHHGSQQQHDQHHQHHHQQQQYHHQPQLQHEMWSDPWGHDKTFESSSHKILVDAAYPYERKYNPYDSWKSEWNGYYYPPPATHASGSNFSRHHPDYDNHF